MNDSSGRDDLHDTCQDSGWVDGWLGVENAWLDDCIDAAVGSRGRFGYGFLIHIVYLHHWIWIGFECWPFFDVVHNLVCLCVFIPHLFLECAFKWSRKINSTRFRRIFLRFARDFASNDDTNSTTSVLVFASVFPCPHPPNIAAHNASMYHSSEELHGQTKKGLRWRRFARMIFIAQRSSFWQRRVHERLHENETKCVCLCDCVCVSTPTICGLFALCTLNPHNINTHTHMNTRPHQSSDKATQRGVKFRRTM